MNQDNIENNNQNETRKEVSNYIKYSSMGFQMIATVLILGLFGKWLDEKMDNHKLYFSLLFLLIGTIGSVALFIKKLGKE